MSDSDALYERDDPAVSGLERELYDAVDAEEPWGLVERFSDLHRVSGTTDERRAAEYLTDRLDALSVPFDRYDPELYVSRPEGAELRVTDRVDRTFQTTKTVAFSADGTVSGEALFLPPATDEDGLLGGGVDLAALDDDVTGRVVVSEAILPIREIAELAEKGAAGFVAVHPHEREPHEGIATPVWGGVPSPDGGPDHPDVGVGTLSRAEGEGLLEFLADGPVELELETRVTTEWAACPLVLARIPGEAAPEEDGFVLAHGHLDSWHRGVTDNATGDAALLELARVFADRRDQLRRDLWVAWWPGHSTGRYAGSTWFVDEFADELDRRCVAHLNVDHPGVDGATDLTDRVKWMPALRELCRGAIADVTGKNAGDGRPSRAGDYSFSNLGVPGASPQSSLPADVRAERGYHAVGGSAGHANAWHLTTDTIEKADPEVLVRDVRVFATILARLLTEAVVPLAPGDAVARHREHLRSYADAAGETFDFDPVLAELDRLDDAVAGFRAAVDDGTVDPAMATDALVALTRTLVRLNFVSEGRFEQDPAYGRPPYPRLAPAVDLSDPSGDDARFRLTHLRRARNDAVARLRRARESLPTGGD